MPPTHPRTNRDVAQTAALIARSFAARYEDMRRRFTLDFHAGPLSHPEHWRVVRRNGRVVAHVGVYVKPVRIGRAVLPMGGLGFVCSDPALRRRGLAAQCVKSALDTMRRNAIPLSFLFGIDRYYTRFGYTGCLPWYTLKLAVPELKSLRNPFRVEPYAPRHLPALLELYESAAAATPASVVRDAAQFRFSLKRFDLVPASRRDSPRVSVFRERKVAGAVRAYAVWKDDSLWEVGVRPGDDAACAAVLAWLRDKRTEAIEKEVLLQNLCPAHPLWVHALRYNHAVEQRFSWTGAGMGRIVDVPGFLAALQPELEARFNGGGWLGEAHLALVVDGRRYGLVFRTQVPGRALLVARVACTSQALLQMALGVLPFTKISGVKTDGSQALLRALFPESSPAVYRLDGF
jgi:predicted N-acetyltransferase YhbS